eukprot:s706_g29.t1
MPGSRQEDNLLYPPAMQAADLQKQSVELLLWQCNDAISHCRQYPNDPNGWPLSLHLLCWAASIKLTPDVVGCSRSIRSCSAASLWRMSSQVLQHMATNQVKPDQISYNSTISAKDQKHWKVGLLFLSEMSMALVSSNVISYSSAIRSCAVRWSLGLQLLHHMRMIQLLPNEIVLNCVIHACVDCWQAALAILSCHLNGSLSFPNKRSYSSAINACANDGQWQVVLRLLADVQDVQSNDWGANEFIYSSAINACEKANQWQRALILFEEMTSKKISANEFIYSSAISACEKAEQWEISVLLLDLMYSAGTKTTDEVTSNGTISSFSKGQQWQQASHFLAAMQKQRAPHDVISYNSTISACERGGEWQLASNLLVAMPWLQALPSEISYNSVISANAEANWQAAICTLKSLVSSLKPPNEISYSSVISGFEKATRWEAALSLLPRACNAVSYNSAIRIVMYTLAMLGTCGSKSAFVEPRRTAEAISWRDGRRPFWWLVQQAPDVSSIISSEKNRIQSSYQAMRSMRRPTLKPSWPRCRSFSRK